jgi:hypothetical protein
VHTWDEDQGFGIVDPADTRGMLTPFPPAAGATAASATPPPSRSPATAPALTHGHWLVGCHDTRSA